MPKKTYKMPLEALMGLLQGKDIHFMTHDFDGETSEIVLMPPHGNVVLTREEFESMKRAAYSSGFMRGAELMNTEGKTKESYDVKEEPSKE